VSGWVFEKKIQSVGQPFFVKINFLKYVEKVAQKFVTLL
jgi:hypothetical protein